MVFHIDTEVILPYMIPAFPAYKAKPIDVSFTLLQYNEHKLPKDTVSFLCVYVVFFVLAGYQRPRSSQLHGLTYQGVERIDLSP